MTVQSTAGQTASPQRLQRQFQTAGERTPGGPRTRVVITGVGVVSPIGLGVEAFWRSLRDGVSAIGRTRSHVPFALPSRLTAEVPDFDARPYVSDRKFLKVMSRDIQFAVSSATMAVRDAGLSRGDVDPVRMGVEFGAGHMGFAPSELSEAAKAMADGDWAEGPMGRIAPLWLLPQLPNMPACHIAIDHDAQGPNNTLTSGDASALLALSEAVRVIERDQADVMIVGAASSRLDPLELARQNLFETLSRCEDPEEAPRPFDRDRDGTIIGEGGGAFVVERYEHAVARGADIYGEVLAVGAGCDGGDRELE